MRHGKVSTSDLVLVVTKSGGSDSYYYHITAPGTYGIKMGG